MNCPECQSLMTKGKKSWFCEECGAKQPFIEENSPQTTDNGDTEEYSITETIAQGKFISLFKVRHQDGNHFFLQKYDSEKAALTDPEKIYFEKTLIKLKNADLPLQIRIFDCRTEKKYFFVLLNHFASQPIKNIFINNSSQSAAQIEEIAFGLLQNIRLLHEAGFIHGCLHPGTILTSFDYKFSAILQNTFYISGENHINPGKKFLDSIAGYSSPELWTNPESLQNNIDFFSFGSLLYFLATRGQNPPQVLFPSKIPPQFRQLIQSCREPHPEKRPANISVLEKMLCQACKRPYLDDKEPQNLELKISPVVEKEYLIEEPVQSNEKSDYEDSAEKDASKKRKIQNPLLKAALTPFQRAWEDIIDSVADSKDKLIGETKQMIANNKKRIISKFEKQPEAILEAEEKITETLVQNNTDNETSNHQEPKDLDNKADKAQEPKLADDETKNRSRPKSSSSKTMKSGLKKLPTRIHSKIENLKEALIKSCLSLGTIIAIFGICYGGLLIWKYSAVEKKDEPILVSEDTIEKKIAGVSISGSVYKRKENYEEWQSFLPDITGLPALEYFKTEGKSSFTIHNYQPAWKMRATENSVLRIRKIESQRRGLGHAIGLNLEDGNFFFHTEESNVLFELVIDSYQLSGRRTSFTVRNHKGVLEIKNSRGALNLKIPDQSDILLSAGKMIKIEHGRVGREQDFVPTPSVFAF